MTVPELVTTNIATFSWWRQAGCSEVTLADCLGILHSYEQHPEYVDGTIKIFDTGSESATPNNYNLVNVRIRSDGYILAWFAQSITASDQTADSGSGVTLTDSNCEIQNYHDSGPRAIVANELAGNILEFTSGDLNSNKYTIQSNTTSTIVLHSKYGNDITTDLASVTNTDTYKITSSRGNLVWWGHTSSATGNPTDQSTRLGRAIYEIWEQLKGNQVGGDGAVVDYTQIRYYDYEYINATYLYIIGHSQNHSVGRGGSSTTDKFYYFTIPVTRTAYNISLNFGNRTAAYSCSSCASIIHRIYYNNILIWEYTSRCSTLNGFCSVQDMIQISGIRNTINAYQYTYAQAAPCSTFNSANSQLNIATVILTNG